MPAANCSYLSMFVRTNHPTIPNNLDTDNIVCLLPRVFFAFSVPFPWGRVCGLHTYFGGNSLNLMPEMPLRKGNYSIQLACFRLTWVWGSLMANILKKEQEGATHSDNQPLFRTKWPPRECQENGPSLVVCLRAGECEGEQARAKGQNQRKDKIQGPECSNSPGPQHCVEGETQRNLYLGRNPSLEYSSQFWTL